MDRIQTSCNSKCINKKFYEGELTTGEGVCLDRCVSKFFATHKKMNDVFSSLVITFDAIGINATPSTEHRITVG